MQWLLVSVVPSMNIRPSLLFPNIGVHFWYPGLHCDCDRIVDCTNYLLSLDYDMSNQIRISWHVVDHELVSNKYCTIATISNNHFTIQNPSTILMQSATPERGSLYLENEKADRPVYTSWTIHCNLWNCITFRYEIRPRRNINTNVLVYLFSNLWIQETLLVLLQ